MNKHDNKRYMTIFTLLVATALVFYSSANAEERLFMRGRGFVWNNHVRPEMAVLPPVFNKNYNSTNVSWYRKNVNVYSTFFK